jgi:DNA-directed RNA polymerase I subunit RPA1
MNAKFIDSSGMCHIVSDNTDKFYHFSLCMNTNRSTTISINEISSEDQNFYQRGQLLFIFSCKSQFILELADLIDINQTYTSDVKIILINFGVEAAQSTVIFEIRTVFKSYGIHVDARHLGLLVAFMLHRGFHRTCHRTDISLSSSPFHRVSSETASDFLTEAAIMGQIDTLTAPSACLTCGAKVQYGSGSFDILCDINVFR